MDDKYNYTKLVEYVRNGLIEQVHFGTIVHMNKKQILYKTNNDNNYKFYHRSCMKPLQAASLIDLDIDKKYNLKLDEIGICCASHCGDITHQNLVLSVLEKTGFKEEDLLCKPILPLSKEEKERLIISKEPIRKIHNNCSGKHAIMLAICKELGFSTNNYKDINHPLTNYIINKVCELCEINKDEILISKDGCGLPVIATSLESLGQGFLNLFLNNKYQKIKNAFLNYPYIIGGKERLDSEIINASAGNLIAKVGACGLCVVVNLEKEECIVVKIADSNMEARSFATINTLIQLKWLDPSRIYSSQINKIYISKIYSQDNEVLGDVIPCFKLN